MPPPSPTPTPTASPTATAQRQRHFTPTPTATFTPTLAPRRLSPDADRDGYIYADCNRDHDRYGYTDANSDSHGYIYANSNGNCYVYADADANTLRWDYLHQPGAYRYQRSASCWNGLHPLRLIHRILSISDLPGAITKVTVKLNNITYCCPTDMDMLLVGPAGQMAIIMSDAGGFGAITNVTLTLDDLAANPLPGGTPAPPVVTGTYQPTNYSSFSEGNVDFFAPPAPATTPGPPSVGSALSVFNGTNPNGTWSLDVMDDQNSGGLVGTIAGGWELTIFSLTLVRARRRLLPPHLLPRLQLLRLRRLPTRQLQQLLQLPQPPTRQHQQLLRLPRLQTRRLPQLLRLPQPPTRQLQQLPQLPQPPTRQTQCYCCSYSYGYGYGYLPSHSYSYSDRNTNTNSDGQSDHGGWNQLRHVLERHGNHPRHCHLPGRQPWQDQECDTAWIMYWVKVTAAAGNNTFVIDQLITTGNFNTQFKLDGGGNVFKGSDCKPAMGVHMKPRHYQWHQQRGHRDVQGSASGRLLHCGEVPDRERWWRSRPYARHNRSLRLFDYRRARLDQ